MGHGVVLAVAAVHSLGAGIVVHNEAANLKLHKKKLFLLTCPIRKLQMEMRRRMTSLWTEVSQIC